MRRACTPGTRASAGIPSAASAASRSHPTATWLAVGGIGQIGNIDHLEGPARVEVFDWKTGKPLPELSDNKHKGLVTQMLFTPHDSQLITVGGDNAGFITVYDAADWKIAFQDKAHQHIHGCVANEACNRITRPTTAKLPRGSCRSRRELSGRA